MAICCCGLEHLTLLPVQPAACVGREVNPSQALAKRNIETIDDALQHRSRWRRERKGEFSTRAAAEDTLSSTGRLD